MSGSESCYVYWDPATHLIRLGNERVERGFVYDPDSNRFSTIGFSLQGSDNRETAPPDWEFRLEAQAGERRLSWSAGANPGGGNLRLNRHETQTLPDGGTRLVFVFDSTDMPAQIRLYHEIHPGCGWIRRWLGMTNQGPDAITILQFVPECLRIGSESKGCYFNSWRWGSRAYVQDLRAYTGTGIHSFQVKDRLFSPPTVPTDSPLVLTDAAENHYLWFFPEVPIGSVVVREDPKPMVYTENCWGEMIAAGQTVEFAAGVIGGIGIGNHREGFRSFREFLANWVVKDKLDVSHTTLVFNSWYGTGYSDTEPCQASCFRQIDLAKELGADLYVLDAGWHGHVGDWDADADKFPHGLRAVSDYCHQRELKFGLWIDSRIACTCSRLYREHPEWLVRQQDGRLYQDQFVNHEIAAMCLASGYGDYLKQRYIQLVTDLQLDCLKIDNVCLLDYYSFWKPCCNSSHDHLAGYSHRAVWMKWMEILDAVRSARPGIWIESIPSGLNLLGKHHGVWAADYQYRPDWKREAYFYRALLHHMAATHPATAIHQGWASTDCIDPATLDYLCASTIGSSAQCGITGSTERVTEVQKAILKKWASWRKENLKYLGIYQPLFDERPPIPMETVEDDVYMQQIANRWKPDEIDGFAHLLPEGGWIFLFNPSDSRKTGRLTLNMKDYGIENFSGITGIDGMEYNRENHTLIFHHTLEPGGFLQSRMYAGHPVRLEKIDARLLKWEWNDSIKELRMVCAGGKGECRMCLAAGGMGRPLHIENGNILSWDSSADRLEIAFRPPQGMEAGSVLPAIRMRWK